MRAISKRPCDLQVLLSATLEGSRWRPPTRRCEEEAATRLRSAPRLTPHSPQDANVEQHEAAGPRMGPMPLETLEGHGCAASDLKKLQEAGYHTVEAVAYAAPRHLVTIKGLSDVKVKKLQDAGAAAGSAGRPGRGNSRRPRARKTSQIHLPHRLPERLRHRPAPGPRPAHHHRLRRARPAAGRCAWWRALHARPPRLTSPHPQAASSPAPSPRFTASSARARRSCATCWP